MKSFFLSKNTFNIIGQSKYNIQHHKNPNLINNSHHYCPRDLRTKHAPTRYKNVSNVVWKHVYNCDILRHARWKNPFV